MEDEKKNEGTIVQSKERKYYCFVCGSEEHTCVKCPASREKLDDTIISLNVGDEKKMEHEETSCIVNLVRACRRRYTTDLSINACLYSINYGSKKKKLISRFPTCKLAYSHDEIYQPLMDSHGGICKLISNDCQIIFYITVGICDDVGYMQPVGISKCDITNLVNAKVNEIYSATSSLYMSKLCNQNDTSEFDFRIKVGNNTLEIEFLSLKLLKSIDFIDGNMHDDPINRKKCLMCFNNPRSAVGNRLMLFAVIATMALSWWCGVESWTFIQSFYFCLETLSTVGYGDQPSFNSPYSIWFNTIFIVVAVVVVFDVANTVISALAEKLKHSVTNKIRKKKKKTIRESIHDVEMDIAEKMDPTGKCRSLPWPFIFFFVLGLIVFTQCELVGKKLNFKEALYFSIVTCTSVGYGDISAQNEGGKLFTGIWLFGILVTFAQFVSNIATNSHKKKEKQKSDRIMAHAFSIEEDFHVFDTDHNNQVSKSEFTLQVLKKLEVINMDDFNDVANMYAAIDTKNNGSIGMDEIKHFLGHQKN